jgi:hypothetical protein
MCQRFTDEKLDPERLSGLVDIGGDEIIWRKPQVPDRGLGPRDLPDRVSSTGKDATAVDRVCRPDPRHVLGGECCRSWPR